eukprot:TRINITY_DN2019_c0_g1_i1.p1 TRINITY_DN2019_c0_g1~~TRINITY_DN2019_c0_g1_i1.p1  ORF type:complete len:128 (+),score=19.07 TRINITY_DN2019_c0_g1_i1:162-545(+)
MPKRRSSQRKKTHQRSSSSTHPKTTTMSDFKTATTTTESDSVNHPSSKKKKETNYGSIVSSREKAHTRKKSYDVQTVDKKPKNLKRNRHSTVLPISPLVKVKYHNPLTSRTPDQKVKKKAGIITEPH